MMFGFFTGGVFAFHLEAAPSVIGPGEMALLQWNIRGATSVFIEAATRTGGLRTIGKFGGRGTLQVEPKEDATYIISCEGVTTLSCASLTIRVRVRRP
jgi:hypothetical protein